MMVEIEKGVPVPAVNRVAKIRYPYGEMEVNDSFLVENTGKNRIVHVCAMNRKMSLKLGKKFTARKMDDGIRVWRIS